MHGWPLAVVPVLVGPLQVLLALLPSLLVAMGGVVLALFRPSAVKKALRVAWRLKPQLLAVVVAFMGARYLLGMLGSQGGAAPAADGTGENWPAFRGGPARLGAPPGTRGPARGGVNWAFDQEADTFYSSAAVVGNRVYIASAQKGVFSDRGAIHCLDAESGAVVWTSTDPDDYRATFSSPSVWGRYLVCGEGLHTTEEARIVCLDVSQEGRGRLLWQFRTRSHVESSACIYEGRVYIGAGEDGYYCLELSPDESGEPVLVWHVSGEDFPDAETAPVAHDGRLYVGLGTGGKAIVCLDAATGEEIWRVRTPYPVFSPPTVAGGRLFVGMGNGDFINRAEDVGLAPAGEVWGIDLADPDRRWTYAVGRTVLGAVAATQDRLFFGSRDGCLYALSHEGKEVGRRLLGEPIVTSPAYADGSVYCVTESGRLYGLDAATLEPVWETALGTGGPFISSPTVADGRVYVGTSGNGLLCLGEPGERGPPPVWAGGMGGPGHGGVIDQSVLPEQGDFLCAYPEDRDEAFAVTAPAAALGDLILLPVSSGPRKGVICLYDARDAFELTERWAAGTANGVSLSPALSPDAALFVDGAEGDEERRLQCVEPQTGAPKWHHPISPQASGLFVLAGQLVCVQDSPGELAALDAAGRALWRRETGELVGEPDLAGPILVVAAASPGVLMALDAATGRELWRLAPDAPPTTGPAVRGDVVYLGTARGMEARSLLDGSAVWRSDAGPVGRTFALSPELLTYVSPTGELVLLDPEDGVEVDLPDGRIGDAVPSVPPLLTREGVLYAVRGGIMRLAPDRGGRRAWMDVDPDWLGQVVSPLIMTRSRVYFATDGRGFIRAGR